MIKQIVKLFFKPLVKHKPEALSYAEWVQALFSIEVRSIVQYRATREIKLPGAFLLSARQAVPGIGYRNVKPGAMLTVRTNNLLPDRIDIHFKGGQGGKDLVYRLTEEQWMFVKLSLEAI